MPSVVSRYATPFVTGLFVVSLVSGIALFFHLGSSLFHSMHEWLSMVLIVPFVLHIWKNWRPFVAYFKRAPMAIALVLSLIMAVPFAMPLGGSEGSGNPMVAVALSVQGGSVETVAGLYRTSADALSAELTKAGYTVASSDQSLSEIAEASGRNERDMMSFLAGLAQSGGGSD